jgi:hypothetical protein
LSHYRLLQCLIVLFLAVPLFAAGPSQALIEDATSYAVQYGVSVDEGVRRLQLQRSAGDLEAALAAEEAGAFAGLWIQHEPEYRIVVRFTNRAAEARLKARVAGGPFEKMIETRGARWTLAELEQQQQDVRDQAAQLKLRLEADINVFDNKVEVYTTEPEKVRGLPEGVKVKRVAKHGIADELLGGDGMGNCSAGFGVRYIDGELGILTAGHCHDTQTFMGYTLPFRAQTLGEHYDVQWNSTCDIVQVSNRFQSGLGTRSVTATRHRDNQAIGTYLCKYGAGTQRTCGTLSSKTYDYGPGYHSTFMRVDGFQLRGPGDSGAPWFVEDVAYGIHLGAPADDANDAIYMAINYVTPLGVAVLTSDPGPTCNRRPFADFYSSQQTPGFYTFDASFSNDPDGYIVSYSWEWGDGTSTTTTEPYAEHYFSAGTWLMSMTVTDNEGATNTMRELVRSCGFRVCY